MRKHNYISDKLIWACFPKITKILATSLIIFGSFLSASAAIPPEAIDVRNFPIQNISGRSQILPLIGQDSDGSIVNFIIKSLPPASTGVLYLNGVAVPNNKTLTPLEALELQFTVKSSYTGDATFTYTVTDNQGLTDATPANFIIPVVGISQNLVCIGGGLGSNILGASGTFSTPFISPFSGASCISNGSNIFSPVNNLGEAHPELTSYKYASTSNGLGPEGTYSFLKIIGTMTSYPNSNCIKTDWVAKDHTGDGGYSMIVNGSADSTKYGKTFYNAQAQQVCPNTLYEFSAYVINVLPGNSPAAGAGSEPNISFYINNTRVSQSGPITYSTVSTGWEPLWVKVGGLWYSGQNTSVDLKIDNATFVASGNDLGLDDISLAICGPDITYPDVDLSPKFCGPGILHLNALVKSSINTYSSYIFERSINGGSTWQSISTAKVGSPVYDIASNTYSYTAIYGDIPVDVTMNGYIYRLKVATNAANLAGNTCNISADKVITVSAFSKPIAGADITGCNPATTAQLVAALSGETWSVVAGNPAAATINNAGSISGMTVNGFYKYQLTNTSGCIDTVEVTRDQIISAGSDVNLCFGISSYKLDDASVGYSWEVKTGNPSNAVINALTGAVSGMTATGTYHFLLRSAYGDCTDEVTITVPAALGLTTTQTNARCSSDTNGSVVAVGQNGYSPYQYKLGSGAYQSNGNFGALAAGAYTITVKDANNCTFSQIITITVEDASPPAFVGTLPGDITVQCDVVPAAATIIATDNYGTPTVTFTEVRNNGACSNSYSLTRTWTAIDACGLSATHIQTITVVDTTLPVFMATDKEYCVANITGAIINEPTIDISADDRPEWYLFRTGGTDLDITDFSDNCTPASSLSVHWKIDFNDGTSLTGNGQVSAYGSDIRLDGAVNLNVTHHITYWLVDQCGNETEKQYAIIIHPRPEIIKQTL